MTTTIAINHETVYTYGAPVDSAQHVAHLRPLEDHRQHVEAFDMTIDPAPSHHGSGRDAFGNSRVFFAVTQPHKTLAVRATSRVRVSARPTKLAAHDTLPWESVAERLRYATGRPYEPAAQFTTPSPYVPRLKALRDLTEGCFPPAMPIAAGAIALMHRLHDEFAYESASTDVDTPLADVLSQRRGVCQDFAHAAIGALRMLGLPARYVSGYLLTDRNIVGADASHAWVAVWCPSLQENGADWLELDPTNAVLPDTGHVRLAVGRDYSDVTPLRGVIRGGGAHTLEVRVHTRRPEVGVEVANEISQGDGP
jgi:transglutaminase-like putative cysteine protease